VFRTELLISSKPQYNSSSRLSQPGPLDKSGLRARFCAIAFRRLREHTHCRLEQFCSIDSQGYSLKHVASSLVREGFASPDNRFRKTANLLNKAVNLSVKYRITTYTATAFQESSRSTVPSLPLAARTPRPLRFVSLAGLPFADTSIQDKLNVVHKRQAHTRDTPCPTAYQ
jgi:hypothetical protein